jgi:4-carboxymuconolactone decarboxylase
MSNDGRLEKGSEVFNQCYGGVINLPPGELDDYQRYTLTSLFAEIWTRPGLSFRDKRLVILGVLAGAGADPSLFEIHARSALKNGELEPQELREVIMITLPYAGFPKTSPLYQTAEKVLKDFETNKK